MIGANYAEIRDLINRGIFRAVLRTELPDGANLIVARFFLAIKSDEDKEERYKERYIFGGRLGIMKDYLAHGEQSIQCVSVRIILVVLKIKGFRICVVGLKLAYLQSDTPLIRKIFITNLAPRI